MVSLDVVFTTPDFTAVQSPPVTVLKFQLKWLVYSFQRRTGRGASCINSNSRTPPLTAVASLLLRGINGTIYTRGARTGKHPVPTPISSSRGASADGFDAPNRVAWEMLRLKKATSVSAGQCQPYGETMSKTPTLYIFSEGGV